MFEHTIYFAEEEGGWYASLMPDGPFITGAPTAWEALERLAAELKANNFKG